MASFTEGEIDQHALDWEILRDGGICLYWKSEVLQADLEWLISHQYEVKTFDSGAWHSELVMHDELSSALAFPSYYGRNLNALAESISEDLVVPDIGGTVLCLRHFNWFANHSELADSVLNIFARASREHMLRGRRFFVLLQSDDARISFSGLGGVSAQWNKREWLLSSRNL